MRRIGWLLLGLGLALIVISGWSLLTDIANRIAFVPPTATTTPFAGEPLVPTAPPVRTPTSSADDLVTAVPITASPTTTAVPARSNTPTARPSQSATMVPATATAPVSQGKLYTPRDRIGIGVPIPPPSEYPEFDTLGAGWYLDWQTQRRPARPNDIEYVQMVRLSGSSFHPGEAELRVVAQEQPGSLWLIGNEPDVIWQDNATPSEYVQAYHTVYTSIRSADPTARIAIGGVSQPTPLRLQYLDAILAEYRRQFGQEMPIDVWNVHNFILREERGAWGVDIPPGVSEDTGRLYAVDDNDNMTIFRQQIIEFRRWMADRGYQDRPLIVSEYGIPMPADYGFPPPRVIAFIDDSFEFFRTATNPAIGYPDDDYRLVQRWCWYSLGDINYPTGNLYDPETREMTEVGEGWRDVIQGMSIQP